MWWQAVLVLAGLAIIAVVFYPVSSGVPTDNARTNCQSNLKQIGLAIKQYNQDYNYKFPPVNLGKQGWADMLQPYLKNTQLFQCPKANSKHPDGKIDYFYNARVAGQAEEKFEYIANTIMTGDGIADAPSNANLTTFPAAWVTEEKSPAWRHLEGANYGFADGHVKWLKPTSVSNEKASSTVNTFAPW